jgi:hypothetical protein
MEPLVLKEIGPGEEPYEEPMLVWHGAQIRGVLDRTVAKRGREIELGGLPHG